MLRPMDVLVRCVLRCVVSVADGASGWTDGGWLASSNSATTMSQHTNTGECDDVVCVYNVTRHKHWWVRWCGLCVQCHKTQTLVSVMMWSVCTMSQDTNTGECDDVVCVYNVTRHKHWWVWWCGLCVQCHNTQTLVSVMMWSVCTMSQHTNTGECDDVVCVYNVTTHKHWWVRWCGHVCTMSQHKHWWVWWCGLCVQCHNTQTLVSVMMWSVCTMSQHTKHWWVWWCGLCVQCHNTQNTGECDDVVCVYNVTTHKHWWVWWCGLCVQCHNTQTLVSAMIWSVCTMSQHTNTGECNDMVCCTMSQHTNTGECDDVVCVYNVTNTQHWWVSWCGLCVQCHNTQTLVSAMMWSVCTMSQHTNTGECNDVVCVYNVTTHKHWWVRWCGLCVQCHNTQTLVSAMMWSVCTMSQHTNTGECDDVVCVYNVTTHKHWWVRWCGLCVQCHNTQTLVSAMMWSVCTMSQHTNTGECDDVVCVYNVTTHKHWWVRWCGLCVQCHNTQTLVSAMMWSVCTMSQHTNTGECDDVVCVYNVTTHKHWWVRWCGLCVQCHNTQTLVSAMMWSVCTMSQHTNTGECDDVVCVYNVTTHKHWWVRWCGLCVQCHNTQTLVSAMMWSVCTMSQHTNTGECDDVVCVYNVTTHKHWWVRWCGLCVQCHNTQTLVSAMMWSVCTMSQHTNTGECDDVVCVYNVTTHKHWWVRWCGLCVQCHNTQTLVSAMMWSVCTMSQHTNTGECDDVVCVYNVTTHKHWWVRWCGLCVQCHNTQTLVSAMMWSVCTMSQHTNTGECDDVVCVYNVTNTQTLVSAMMWSVCTMSTTHKHWWVRWCGLCVQCHNTQTLVSAMMWSVCTMSQHTNTGECDDVVCVYNVTTHKHWWVRWCGLCVQCHNTQTLVSAMMWSVCTMSQHTNTGECDDVVCVYNVTTHKHWWVRWCGLCVQCHNTQTLVSAMMWSVCTMSQHTNTGECDDVVCVYNVTTHKTLVSAMMWSVCTMSQHTNTGECDDVVCVYNVTTHKHWWVRWCGLCVQCHNTHKHWWVRWCGLCVQCHNTQTLVSVMMWFVCTMSQHTNTGDCNDVVCVYSVYSALPQYSVLVCHRPQE